MQCRSVQHQSLPHHAPPSNACTALRNLAMPYPTARGLSEPNHTTLPFLAKQSLTVACPAKPHTALPCHSAPSNTSHRRTMRSVTAPNQAMLDPAMHHPASPRHAGQSQPSPRLTNLPRRAQPAEPELAVPERARPRRATARPASPIRT